MYVAIFGQLAARAYSAHESAGAYDLGNHVQSLWYAARGEGLKLTLVPEFGSSRFSMHVEPTLFLLAPVYRFLTDDPRSLLWIQAVIMALAAWPLYHLARRRLCSDWAALLGVFSLFLLPAFESATLFEFHAVSLAPTFLLTSLFFVDRVLLASGDQRGIWTGKESGRGAMPSPSTASRQWYAMMAVLAGLFLLLALGTKEDVSLSVVMLGAYFLFSKRWRLGTGLSLLGLAWFLIAAYVIVPANRPDGTHSAYLGFFSELGQTPIAILTSPFREPAKILGMIFSRGAVKGMGMLLVPLALVPVFGWRFLLLAAPVLAVPLLSSNPMMNKLETYHYAAPAIAFLMLAMVDGIARLGSASSQFGRLWASGHRRAVGSPGRKAAQNGSRSLTIWISIFVLLVGLVYHVFRGYSPLSLSFHWPLVTRHEQIGDQLATSIPENAPVLAQAELVPLVARRPWVRIWHGPFDEEAQYVFLDVSHPRFVNRNGAQERLLADMAFDPSMGMIASSDGYFLLERGADRVATSPEFFTFVFADAPSTTTAVDAVFGDELRLIAYQTSRQVNDREGEPLISLYWEVLKQPAEDYLITIFLLDDEQAPVGAALYQQPVTVWWPTSRWESGAHIRLLANTFPWWTGDRKSFWYAVAVVRGKDPWAIPSRLPVVRRDNGSAPIDGDSLLPLVEFNRIAGIPYAR